MRSSDAWLVNSFRNSRDEDRDLEVSFPFFQDKILL